MALSANTVLEVRLTGDDANGGGFVTGASGTDRSQQDAAHATLTTASTVHTTTTQINVNAADYTVTAADVGNLFQINSGTATAGTYQITAADTVNNRWTVDRSVGTSGQTCAGKMGGALASPGKAGGVAAISGNIVFIKYNASPYVITTASTNVSGGCVNGVTGVTYAGYDTVRSLYQIFANRPTLQLDVGVSTATIIGGTNNASYLQGLILDGNDQTSSQGVLNSGEFFFCKAIRCKVRGLSQNSPGRGAFYCEVANCTFSGTNIGISQSFTYSCVIHDCTTSGSNIFVFGSGTTCINCVAYNITTGDGFGGGGTCVNCIAYNCVHGFNAHNSVMLILNSIAENNTGYGFRINSASGGITMLNCASYNNTLGRSVANSGRLQDINTIVGSGSFFVDAPNKDFTLNNNAGGGASARSAGFPSSMVDLSLTTSPQYIDVGALQAQASAVVAQLKQFGRGAPY